MFCDPNSKVQKIITSCWVSFWLYVKLKSEKFAKKIDSSIYEKNAFILIKPLGNYVYSVFHFQFVKRYQILMINFFSSFLFQPFIRILWSVLLRMIMFSWLNPILTMESIAGFYLSSSLIDRCEFTFKKRNCQKNYIGYVLRCDTYFLSMCLFSFVFMIANSILWVILHIIR